MRWQRRMARLGLITGVAFVGTSVLGLGLVTLSGAVGPPDPARSAAAAGAGTCRVIRVSDGRTLRMDCGHGAREVRVMGFDTPQTLHPKCAAEKKAGEEATRRMSALVASGPVTGLRVVGTDSAGRDLARVSIGGKDVTASMLRTGYARPDDGQGGTDWCGIIVDGKVPSAGAAPAASGPARVSRATGPAVVSRPAAASRPARAPGPASPASPAGMFTSTRRAKPGQAFRPAPAFKSTD